MNSPEKTALKSLFAAGAAIITSTILCVDASTIHATSQDANGNVNGHEWFTQLRNPVSTATTSIFDVDVEVKPDRTGVTFHIQGNRVAGVIVDPSELPFLSGNPAPLFPDLIPTPVPSLPLTP